MSEIIEIVASKIKEKIGALAGKMWIDDLPGTTQFVVEMSFLMPDMLVKEITVNTGYITDAYPETQQFLIDNMHPSRSYISLKDFVEHPKLSAEQKDAVKAAIQAGVAETRAMLGLNPVSENTADKTDEKMIVHNAIILKENELVPVKIYEVHIPYSNSDNFSIKHFADAEKNNCVDGGSFILFKDEMMTKEELQEKYNKWIDALNDEEHHTEDADDFLSCIEDIKYTRHSNHIIDILQRNYYKQCKGLTAVKFREYRSWETGIRFLIIDERVEKEIFSKLIKCGLYYHKYDADNEERFNNWCIEERDEMIRLKLAKNGIKVI